MLMLTLHFNMFVRHVPYTRTQLAKELRQLRRIGASIWKMKTATTTLTT